MFGRCNVSFERLVDFALGQLGDDEAALLQTHLASGCRRCQREVRWLRAVTGIMAADNLVEPPAWLSRRAVNLFAQRYTPAAAEPSFAKRIAACLLFDSQLAMPAAGLRTGGPAERQLLYRAADLDIDLHIKPGEREAEFSIIGQMLPMAGDLAAVAGVEVQLLRGHRRVLVKTTDSLGEFTFGRLTPGKYGLRIRLPDQEVDLVGIDMSGR